MSDLDLDAIEARANAALTSPLGQQYDAAVILAADVPALVAEVRRLRERAEAHAVTVQQAVAVERQRDEARAAIAAVRALHVKATRYTSGSSVNTHVPLTADYCVHCGPLLWPCATIRALDVRHDPSATTGRCPTPGCPGDWRYAAPGRGHTAECKHPADFRAWVGQAFPPSSDPSATTDGGAS